MPPRHDFAIDGPALLLHCVDAVHMRNIEPAPVYPRINNRTLSRAMRGLAFVHHRRGITPPLLDGIVSKNIKFHFVSLNGTEGESGRILYVPSFVPEEGGIEASRLSLPGQRPDK